MTPMIMLAKKVSSFSPSSITGLRLWVQADNLVLSDNDPISTWTDLSGNSNDFTGTTTTRPLYKTNIQNGKPVVRFDGTDDFMEKATPTGLDGGGSGLTIFLVVKHPLATNKTFLTKWDFQTQGSWGWQTSGTDEMIGIIANGVTDNGTNSITSTNADLTATFYLLEMVYDGTQANADRIKFYRNTSLRTSSVANTVPTTLTSATATLKLGRFGGSLTRYFTGDIGEILIYDSALSDGNRALNQTYLNGRWAIY